MFWVWNTVFQWLFLIITSKEPFEEWAKHNTVLQSQVILEEMRVVLHLPCLDDPQAFCNNVLWDESGRPVKANPASTKIPTVKHGGGSAMLWRCFGALAPAFIFALIDGNENSDFNQKMCLVISLIWRSSAVGLCRKIMFQRTAEWLKSNKIRVLEWSWPDEMPWEDLKWTFSPALN